ncbi:MAG: ATP-binding cassette domain-containing protein [bacterium]
MATIKDSKETETMITTSKLTLSFGSKTLFQDVSVKFVPGNCYGLIGANGAGKSTLLKIIAGDILPTEGQIHVEPGATLSVLKQDQFAYDDEKALDTVMMGYKKLYKIYKERQELYAKDELSDAEGERVGNLEGEFGELDGYRHETDAAMMLSELGLTEELHDKEMKYLEAADKFKVLLAQALFAEPDILLLDEPTNHLDYQTIVWLEDYLLDFKNTVIVVSHDRHFLNKVCTHIADVDYGKIKIYPGNYSFWRQASELAIQQRQDQAAKDSKKVQQLEEFVRRFSANASKSKQATSRKKLIEKLRPDELPVSIRRAPFIQFKAQRSLGNRVLQAENISIHIEGVAACKNLSFEITKGEKVAIIGKNSVAKTALLSVIAGEQTPDTGHLKWGESVQHAYFPKDNNAYFDSDLSLLDWLMEGSPIEDSQEIRGYLGRMLFSGDEVNKAVRVLSGGEKARAMFSRMMLKEPNVLIFDEPTDHLDLESISALNTALEQVSDCIIFTSHDTQLLNTVANRIIEISETGFIDHRSNLEDYMNNHIVQEKREALALC